MVHLFLLCVDRDGQPGRRAALDNIEVWAAGEVGQNKRFFGVEAWQELEVWVLAGHDLLDGWQWADIRNEIHPKELYFLPFAAAKGVTDQPGDGRHALAEEAIGRYDRIRQLCPEDVGHLERRVTDWLADGK